MLRWKNPQNGLELELRKTEHGGREAPRVNPLTRQLTKIRHAQELGELYRATGERPYSRCYYYLLRNAAGDSIPCDRHMAAQIIREDELELVATN